MNQNNQGGINKNPTSLNKCFVCKNLVLIRLALGSDIIKFKTIAFILAIHYLAKYTLNGF